MNKQDFIAIIAEDTGESKAKTQLILDSVLKNVTKLLANGDDLTFVGFGKFETKDRPASTGRNPQTGAEIQISASKQVKFKVGKDLKDTVNGKKKAA